MNPYQISILQWNVVPFIKLKLEEVMAFISRHEVDMMCLQEINLHNMRKDQRLSTRRKGYGITLMIRKEIPLFLVAQKVYLNEFGTITVYINNVMESCLK
jgi:hypothetical protein